MHARVIGIGNLERCDDSAGLLVAKRLREMNVDAVDFSGEALSLMDFWEGFERVILVDAVVTGQPAGTIVLWDASGHRVPRDAFRFSTHTFGVADAVELAHMLEKTPPELLIYGIEGRHFHPGTKAGKRVLDAVQRLAVQIANEVSECAGAKGSGSSGCSGAGSPNRRAGPAYRRTSDDSFGSWPLRIRRGARNASPTS